VFTKKLQRRKFRFVPIQMEIQVISCWPATINQWAKFETKTFTFSIVSFFMICSITYICYICIRHVGTGPIISCKIKRDRRELRLREDGYAFVKCGRLISRRVVERDDQTLPTYIILLNGVNPERVLGYCVKTGNRLRVPGFFAFNTRPRTRIPRVTGFTRIPG